MLWQKRPDYKVVSTAWAHSTVYQVPLSREFWLESIKIMIQGNVGTGAGTLTGDGWEALIKRVRLSVSDATGNRKVIDCTGPALIEYWRQLNGGLDRVTNAGLSASGSYTGAIRLFYTVPFRHPLLADPWGATTMLPLPRLSSDPILEIETGAATDVGSALVLNATTTPLYLTVQINRRDVLSLPKNPHPYIPGELITYDKQWNSAGGKQDWEIPPIGTVTGILQQDYRTTTTRGCVQSTVYEDVSIEKLSTIIRRQQVVALQAENDDSVELFPATWINIDGAYYHDFLTDYDGQTAFTPSSCLDLNPLAMGGKARIILGNVSATANYFTRFTVHKLFGDLRSLVGV